MDPMQMKAWEEFLRASVMYGLAFVFTAGVLGSILRVTFIATNLMREWVPKYIAAKIDSEKRLSKAVELMQEDLRCVHDRTHASNQATILLSEAFEPSIVKHQHQIGIDKEGVDKVKRARSQLGNT